jgi:predicted nucleotide-binding protein
LAENRNGHAFIVHGHSDYQCLQLKNWLSSLSISAMLLEEEDDRGLSIIDKFEYYARQCTVAFILLTPDDRIAERDAPHEEFVARQNAMIELGWFLRHLGRQAVIILYQDGTTLPSEIGGILSIKFSQSILETTERIRKRLEGLHLL